jgi:hypothetical protein
MKCISYFAEISRWYSRSNDVDFYLIYSIDFVYTCGIIHSDAMIYAG